MSLKFRILSSVIGLVTLCITIIILFSGYEFHSVMKQHHKEMNKEITDVDNVWNNLVRVYLSNQFKNITEKINSVFYQIDTVPKWKVAFLPDKYNMKENICQIYLFVFIIQSAIGRTTFQF